MSIKCFAQEHNCREADLNQGLHGRIFMALYPLSQNMQSLYRTLQGLGISALNIGGIVIEVTFPPKLLYIF